MKRQAEATFDDRSRGQVMADTAYQRITGRPEVAEPIAVNLVMGGSDAARRRQQHRGHRRLRPHPGRGGPHAGPGRGTGPAITRDAAAAVPAPSSGALVAMESRARRFPRGLARFIARRDQRCRTPYCDAPIRHTDYAVPKRRGGPTHRLNGLGLCERCNYNKEAPGWQVNTCEVDGAHQADFVTPTGVHHRSTAPPTPGPPPIEVTEIEARIAIELVHLHAA